MSQLLSENKEVEDLKPARSIRRNMASAFTGNVVFSLTQWIVISAVAKLATPVEVGYVTLATALVTPVFFLAAMHMREAPSVDDFSRFAYRDYFALRYLNTLLAVLVCCVLAFAFYGDAGWSLLGCIVAYTGLKAVGNQSNLNYGMFQRAERLDWVSTSLIVRGCLGSVTFAVVFWLSKDLFVAFLAEAVAWLLVLAIYDFPRLSDAGISHQKRNVLACDMRTVGSLIVWLLPLGISGFLMNLCASAPRVIAENYLDMAELGIFGAIAFINSALITVSNSVGSAASRRLAVAFQNGNRSRFLVLTLKLVTLSGLLGLGLIVGSYLLGGTALGLLYTSEYVSRSDLLTIVMGATAIQIASAPFQFAVTAGHAFYRRLAINLLTLVAIVGLAYFLIPRWGADGAAWTMVGGAGVRFVLSALAFFVLLSKFRVRSEATLESDNGS